MNGSNTYPTDAHGSHFLYHFPQDDNVNKRWDVYISTTSGPPRNLTRNSDISNANNILGTFSPNGVWVAFVSDSGGGWAIWVIPAAGGEAIRLFEIPLHDSPIQWVNERITWGQ